MNIYLACLAAYNNGFLHGEWINNIEDLDVDTINEEIQAMLKESPIPGAEEYAIHDYESPVKIEEYTSIEELVEIGELITEHGETAVTALYEEYKDYLESGEFTIHENWDAIIEQWYENMEVPEHLAFYINDDLVKRDMDLEGTYIELEDRTVVQVYY